MKNYLYGTTLLSLAALGLTARNAQGKTFLKTTRDYELSKTQIEKIEKGKAPSIGKSSPYFGKRKKPVLAITKDGSKKLMALKNALKKNLDFTTI